jgi:BRCT domain type II-containing protein
MEGTATTPANPICPGVQQSTGPPPSMVKSGISTIEDLSCKDPQQTEKCCPLVAENSAEISAMTENVTEETKTVNNTANSNSGKTIPDVAIVLVHNH